MFVQKPLNFLGIHPSTSLPLLSQMAKEMTHHSDTHGIYHKLARRPPLLNEV